MKAEWTNKDVLTQSETTGLNSKAVLVVDIPNDYGDCELSEYSRGWNDCLDEIFGD